MAAPKTISDPLADLIFQIDEAMKLGDGGSRAVAVRDLLASAICHQPNLLPDRFLVPSDTGYARRLVHLDAQDRYSVVAMVWAAGQGTPLHDHDGHWCVECVYEGSIRMVIYNPSTDPNGEVVQFEPEREEFSHVGDADAFIPPFEYHTIENFGGKTAVTLHVYSQELKQCTVYLPVEGGYKPEVRQLRLLD